MRDLTNLKTYIIDSKNPNEVDDALSLELSKDKEKKLWIHISNPCKLFLFESKIDLDARKRNSSLYLIDEYIPMLPSEVIEKANLKQNKVSETISASIIFNDDGSIKDYEILEAIIRPNYQLTYEDVEDIIELEPKEETDLIEIKNLLIRSINLRRKQGAIVFDMPNIKIKNNNGTVEIIKIENTTAQKLVSESMILMGYITSLYLFNNKISIPFRTQRINCDANEILEKYKESEVKYSILKQYMGKSYITTKASSHESLVVQRQIYNHINNYEIINHNKITEIIDYTKIKQLEINNIYKNNRLKFLILFFTNLNKSFFKIIFIKWINFKKNIALVYFPDYSLEILINLYISIEIYTNKIYKVKYNINDKNLLEFIH